jgi:lipopolysaccharide export system protein LptA
MMKKGGKSLSLFFGVLFLAAGVSWGGEKPLLPSEKSKGTESRRLTQPLRITSQQLEADNKNRVITFRGKVEAKQGEMTITADVAQVFYEKKEEGNEIREIVATGNVKMQEGDRLATGQKAVFVNAEQKIVLTGQPRIWQGKDMVSGERIVVLLEEDKSLVESGPDQRVEVILHPKGEGRPGKGAP